MTVASTSKIALEKIRPKLNGRRLEVLNAIKRLKTASNEQIATELELPINRVTDRVTELHNMAYIEIAFIAKGSTGHSMKYWKLSPYQDKEPIVEQDCPS